MHATGKPRQTKLMTSPLKKEFEYYIAHQDEIVKGYNGKFVVIKNCEIIGAYDNELEAVRETLKTHTPGTFLVQHVSPGETEYTQTFHSRVAFV
jgi:hypothetical protein